MENKGFLESVKGWPSATKNYIDELRLEMRKVSWPNRKQVENTTVVVILTVFAFAAYFAVVDDLLNRSVTKVFQVLSK